MSRSDLLIDIAYILCFSLLIVLLSNWPASPQTSFVVPSAASSTLSIVPSLAISPNILPSLSSPVSAMTAAAQGKAPTKKNSSPAPGSSVPAASPPPPTALAQATTTLSSQEAESTPLEEAAVALRKALVNVICYIPATSSLHSISGSGVIIDPKGFILTNAHVAQYFLLANLGVSCKVRTGSPATSGWNASLVFISPAWIAANQDVLTQSSPIGTGEHDYALLAITTNATAEALPAAFPSVPLATDSSSVGMPIAIASYGAQSLGYDQIQSALYPTVVLGSVKDIFTFGLNTVDVLALGGSAAAQEGSSGGGVANTRGELVGTITTSTVNGDIRSRDLDAITASYIRSDYTNETGQTIDTLLAEPVATAIAAFAGKIPALEALITAHL